MTDYANYNKSPNTAQGLGYQSNLAKVDTKAKTDTPKISKGRDYKIQDSTHNLKTADASRNFFSSLPSQTTPSSSSSTNQLKHHEFGVSDTPNGNDSPLEKASTIAKTIMPEPNSKLNAQTEPQTNEMPPEIENFLKADNFTAKINAMTEDELIEASENPDLTEDELNKIEAKIEELILSKEEILENVTLTYTDLDEQDKDIGDTKTEILLQSEEFIIEGAKSAEISKVSDIKKSENTTIINEQTLYVLTPIKDIKNGFIREKLTAENSNKGYEVVHVENGTMKASANVLKSLKGIETYSKDQNGNLVKDNLQRKALTKEEEETLKTFIEANYQPVSSLHEEEKEENKTNEQSSHVKSNDSDIILEDEKSISNDKPANGHRLESAQASSSGVSINERSLQRLEKLEEEIRLLEDKIDKDIQKHEQLVTGIKIDEQASDTKKMDYMSNELTADTLVIENQYKAVLKEVSDDKGVEIPLAMKFKSMEVIFHKVENLIAKMDSGEAKNNFIVEINTLKKQVTHIAVEALNTSGVQVTKGTSTQGKTSLA
ncbi:MAG: hypothetical protein H0U27_12690 [Nitrosopumilus sp.]|nr:hypothetical protein [Nitrosopumilus sp.]